MDSFLLDLNVLMGLINMVMAWRAIDPRQRRFRLGASGAWALATLAHLLAWTAASVLLGGVGFALLVQAFVMKRRWRLQARQKGG